MRYVITILFALAGCSAPQTILTPELVRDSAAAKEDKNHVLVRWTLAVDLVNEFLSSSYNELLPFDSRVDLRKDGMHYVTPEGTLPIPIALVDDYPKSACICWHADTHDNVMHAYRPWGTELSQPIETNNNFFDPTAPFYAEPTVSLANWLLGTTVILHFGRETHISKWERFKCQYLEWLIGSGHHKVSMQRPKEAWLQFGSFWHESYPLTPTALQVIMSAPDSGRRLEERRRASEIRSEAREHRPNP